MRSLLHYIENAAHFNPEKYVHIIYETSIMTFEIFFHFKDHEGWRPSCVLYAPHTPSPDIFLYA